MNPLTLALVLELESLIEPMDLDPESRREIDNIISQLKSRCDADCQVSITLKG
ncbi:hypothetical protein [Aeromonas sp. ASNIH1]|uniref:hypothetical protein n=1 Tax=Aeromonas sp. ASNIH1 TaxID=1636606 RepID=UPI0013154529|nr:hypothetical protein [Aeromonas sp. ASNIH1]